jgi:predicted transcriptional regulator
MITGEYIRQLRKEKDVTQKDLASLAEISQAHIAKIENGKVDPRLSTVNKILFVLNSLEKQKTCGDLMSKDILSATPDTPVLNIINLIKESGVSQIPILDQGRNMGSVQEITLIHNMDKNLSDLEAKDIMESPFPVINSKDPVDMAKTILDFHPAVLVSDKGKISGIITKTDLLGTE